MIHKMAAPPQVYKTNVGKYLYKTKVKETETK